MVAAAAAYVLHLLFAALWTGSVLFAVHAVFPLARDASIDTDALGVVVGRLTTVSRTSALVLLLTGGYMAGTTYTVESLTSSGRGHLVLTMVVLWFALAALVEIGVGRMREGLDVGKVREPERDSRRLFQAASVVAILLLADAGVLIAGLPG